MSDGMVWTPIDSAEKSDCEPVLLLIDGPDDLAPIVGYWAHHEWVSLESDAVIFPRYCAPIPVIPRCAEGGTAKEPRTLKEGEIAVRLDVLNALRISLADIREMVGAMQSIEDSGAWMLKEAAL